MLEAILSFFGNCAALFGDLIGWLVDVIGHLGYAGIVGLMFLESSFFPFPSEVVMPPAGYLAWKGEMNVALVLGAGILGSILGALFNYWIAVRWGRPFFEKYGKYFFVTHESLDKAEIFFAHHGHISTFTGRLLPVIRQYISLPAGLARMPLPQFCFLHCARLRRMGHHTDAAGLLPRQQRSSHPRRTAQDNDPAHRRLRRARRDLRNRL